MAIVFLQQKKTQRNLILVFVGIIIITAVIIWWGVFKEEKELLKEKTLYPYQKEVEIDFDLLKSQALKKLEPFTEIEPFSGIPEVEGETGRENPFSPF